LNVSARLEERAGLPDVYLGVPCVVGRKGVLRMLDVPLHEEERMRFADSARTVRERIEWALSCLR
jgi:L-lactate dehydrogenase